MTDKPEFAKDLPQRPFSYQVMTTYIGKTGFVYILDAKGRKIASLWGTPKEKIALAELICDASVDGVKAPEELITATMAAFNALFERCCSKAERDSTLKEQEQVRSFMRGLR
jgi:hypothetical protein